ncbi:hypothetical protein HOY34_01080 [Xinfangfangia sp. D13-10-4-6]|uniref:hypothetical protein n=1 Tax=Pseudogemmobacter hezensis TaxID=2737662 RepID=UPI001553985E|nr:hypothetical protein [Pseudogemmobacter hezensis]NPD13792.1 hypothetical protein [Pseudogemmobacter hezensis]
MWRKSLAFFNPVSLRACAMLIVAAALSGPLAGPLQAAWFSDNGDREALSQLREGDDALRSNIERAVLTASNRIGWVEISQCGWASNAVLVTVGGQDYAITSLHLMTGKGPGEVHCEPGLAAEYLPNAAYIQLGEYENPGDTWTDFVYERVSLEGPPVNFSRSGSAMPWVHDWVAFRLSRNVSDDIMPEGAWGAGERRGAIRWSERQNPAGPVWVIGYDGRFGDENGWQFSWQGCEQRRLRGEETMLYFSCDITPGASSSLIATMEEGELTLQGIVTATMSPLIGMDKPLPKNAFLWNMGTTSVPMRQKLDPSSLKHDGKGWQAIVPWN